MFTRYYLKKKHLLKLTSSENHVLPRVFRRALLPDRSMNHRLTDMNTEVVT